MKVLSIIVPCYNEQEVLSLFYRELMKILDEISDVEKEIIFINDGSEDNTMRVIKELELKDNTVKHINFSRNFGKEAAILAGLTNAKGDYVVLMDADLQHPPAKILEMYHILLEKKCDMVTTRRMSRKGESKIRSFFANLFYKIINKISEIKMVPGSQDFRIMTRQVVDSILEITEYNRFSKGIFNWVGYDVHYIELENVERAAGTTSWSFCGLFKYAIEGMVSFTTAPLKLATIFGSIMSFGAFIYLAYLLIKTWLFGRDISGFPTIVSLILILGGSQLLALGIIGEYLSKTYLESKNRPKYFIKDKKL